MGKKGDNWGKTGEDFARRANILSLPPALTTSVTPRWLTGIKPCDTVLLLTVIFMLRLRILSKRIRPLLFHLWRGTKRKFGGGVGAWGRVCRCWHWGVRPCETFGEWGQGQ